MEQNLGGWISWARNQLSAVYPDRECEAITTALFRHLTGYSRMEQVLRSDDVLAPSMVATLQSLVSRLVRLEPLQYVLGETEFYGYKFMVGPGVLIPRPETEELVAWVVAEQKVVTSRSSDRVFPWDSERGASWSPDSHPHFRILDVGTGSGCLAVSLALLFPHAGVVAVDVSAAALEIARQNAALHQVTIQWIQSDFLACPECPDRFGPYDVIVSNPPYVSQEQQTLMSANVLDYEPHQALFPSGADVLIFYRHLADYARRTLVPGGALYVEINEDFPNETAAIFRAAGLTGVELRRDISGKWRMCRALKEANEKEANEKEADEKEARHG